MAAVQGRMDTVTVYNGDAAFNTEAEVIAAIAAGGVVGTDYVIWELTVPAQQKVRWGYGTPQLPMNQGRIYFMILDATTAYEQGIVSLCNVDAPRLNTKIAKRFDDNMSHAAALTYVGSRIQDINQMIALPECGVLTGKDSRLQITYTPTVVVAGIDRTAFSIPITRYMV